MGLHFLSNKLYIACIVAVLFILLLPYIDGAVLQYGWGFYKRTPDFDLIGIARSIGILASTTILFLFVRKFGGSLEHTRSIGFYEWILITVAFVSSLSFSVILIFSPELFFEIRQEDGFIEYASAFSLLIGSAILAFTLFRFRPQLSFIQIGALILMSLVLFIIGMEEVSWFQRVLEIETPEQIQVRNQQEELNFHNMATWLYENAYYFGAFVAFVCIPFVYGILKKFKNRVVQDVLIFTPSIAIVLVSLPIYALNFDMWDGVLIQIAFWAALLTIVFGVIDTKLDVPVAIVMAIFLVAIQVINIVYGPTMIEPWGNTEYKEFYIAFAFLLYAFEVYRNIRANKGRSKIKPD